MVMRNPQQTRHRLLQAAIQQLVTLGSVGIRVDQLAADAGVNKRMIYHYFGNKEGLCAWALDSQVVCLERYESEQRRRPQLDGDVSESLLARALRDLLGPLLPEQLPERPSDLSDAKSASLVLVELHPEDAHGIQRAAIIVLRALLDLRGGQPEYRLARTAEAAWRQVMPWLMALAASEVPSGSSPALLPPAKRRMSLSPVIHPISKL
jgi:AcrR family transcriptional regulator